jgi:uncharacterized protein with PQ loop repeat
MAADIAATILSYAVDVFTVAGVVWPYIPQALSIWRTKNAEAFSLKISLVVIVSATTRVAFWFGSRYPTALLVQAIMSALAQLGMVWLIVQVRAHNRAEAAKGGRARPAPRRTFSDLDASTFWAWDDFTSYLQFEGVLVMALMLFGAAFGGYGWYTELLGTLALGIEALLPVPQALRNYQAKSTAGLSGTMVVSWLLGDIFKTIYAIAKPAPVQFMLCGAFQSLIDVVVFVQMQWCYRERSAAARARVSDVDRSLELPGDGLGGNGMSPVPTAGPPDLLAGTVGVLGAEDEAEARGRLLQLRPTAASVNPLSAGAAASVVAGDGFSSRSSRSPSGGSGSRGGSRGRRLAANVTAANRDGLGASSSIAADGQVS